MEIIQLKKNVYCREKENKFYIFNYEDMYILDKNIHKTAEVIEFLKSLRNGISKEKIKEDLHINDYLIEKYLEIFKKFLEVKFVSTRILLVGKTMVNNILFQNMENVNDISVSIIEETDKNLTELISLNDIVIMSQNIEYSNYYNLINEYCSKLSKIILNIHFCDKYFVIGPYLKNDGKDEFCYECLRKRREANELNKKKIDLFSNMNDKKYRDLMNYKLSIKVSELIEKFIVEKRDFDRSGVYLIDEQNKLKFIKLYAIPYCKKCCKKNIKFYNEEAKFSRDETSQIKLDFINEKYGIFKKIQSVKTILKSDNIYYYTIQIPCIVNQINNIENMEKYEYNIAGGVALDKKVALGKSIGEAVERYCLEAYQIKDFLNLSMKELDKKGYKYLKDINLFDEWQYESIDFPYVKLQKNVKIFWTEAYELHSNTKIYVPANFIYSRYKKVLSNNNIGSLTTSGAACSVDFKSAVLYGIYELIERDSTMIVWLQKLAVPRVTLDMNKTQNNRLKRVLNVLNENNIKFEIFYMTLDLEIPSFMVIAHSDNKKLPARLIGAGCRLDKDEALIRALEEIIQGCGWVGLNEKNKYFEPGENYQNVIGFQERVCLYARKDMEEKLDFLLSTKNSIKYEDIENRKISLEEAYNLCLDILKKKNLLVIAKDISSEDVGKLGFTVVKVLIPGLQQIEANHNYRYLNCLRSRVVPLKLGYKDIQLDSKFFNDAPHPFP